MRFANFNLFSLSILSRYLLMGMPSHLVRYNHIAVHKKICNKKAEHTNNMSLDPANLKDFLATLTGQEVVPAKSNKKMKLDPSVSSQPTLDSEFGLGNLNKLEHCARTLQKAIRTIVDEAPDLSKLEELKNSKDLDQFAAQDIKENHLLHLICDLKTQYQKGNLKVFDRILENKFFNSASLDTTSDTYPHKTPSGRKQNENSSASTKEYSSLSKPRKHKSSSSSSGLPDLPEIYNPRLHSRVFSHKSMNANKTYLAEEEIILLNNERLEFLGDSVLHFVTTRILYDRFPLVNEGFLSTWRATLVCNKTLAEWSTKYGFDGKLRSKVDNSAFITGKQKITADIFEAYVGALAIDRDYDLMPIKDWLTQLMAPILAKAEVELKKNSPINKDAKSQLYSLIGSALMHPSYKVTSEASTFNGAFSVECCMGDDVLGSGTASNLKDAGLRAAMNALSHKDKIEKYVRMRLQTDRSVSRIKSSDSSADPTAGSGTSQPQEKSKFPLVADKTVLGNKFAKNEVYAFLNQAVGVKPDYKSSYDSENKRYICEFKILDVTLAIAYDTSKKNAESRAATMILQNKHLLQEMMNLVA
ncbi:hypothetical protein PUMCH_003349 [Australozyma saopauloensis]|uniref:ribonuclease III n=1 Tax=Australozyma saopauloensis TaxID=291208 RepID=A0AAX4HBX6_9ASCO|nr:hypothetical protein PUMCH_003349 [[Candida] saopauloensis]